MCVSPFTFICLAKITTKSCLFTSLDIFNESKVNAGQETCNLHKYLNTKAKRSDHPHNSICCLSPRFNGIERSCASHTATICVFRCIRETVAFEGNELIAGTVHAIEFGHTCAHTHTTSRIRNYILSIHMFNGFARIGCEKGQCAMV